MSKTFIEVTESSKKHLIFTGKNALMQAVYFDENGVCATPDQLYRFKGRFKKGASWSNGKSMNPITGTNVEGKGVHAKMYITSNDSVILSSQNNGASPLFEFAILYQGKGKQMTAIKKFISRSIDRAKSYSQWWVSNKKWLSK